MSKVGEGRMQLWNYHIATILQCRQFCLSPYKQQNKFLYLTFLKIAPEKIVLLSLLTSKNWRETKNNYFSVSSLWAKPILHILGAQKTKLNSKLSFGDCSLKSNKGIWENFQFLKEFKGPCEFLKIKTLPRVHHGPKFWADLLELDS